MFDWSDVRVFLTVQRTGSFTAAARELRIDQTTVGRRVATLEAALGSRLFRRGRDGLTLTAAGKDIVAAAERMEGAALALGRTAEGRDRAVEGLVRITTFQSMAEYVLAPGLVDLHRRHPKLVIDLHTDDRSLSLTRREADLAVRFGRPDQAELVVRRLAKVAYAVYAARAYAERHRISVDHLERHPLVAYNDDPPLLPQARWLAERAGPSVVRSNDTNVLIAALVAGAGIGILPCYAGDRHAELVRVVDPVDVVSRDLLLVVHAELQRVPKVRAVADAAAAAIEANLDLLAGKRPRRP